VSEEAITLENMMTKHHMTFFIMFFVLFFAFEDKLDEIQRSC